MNGTSSLGIGLTMFLRDQFTGPAGKIRSSNRALQADLRKTQEEQLRYERNLNAGVALMGTGALRGMTRMVEETSKFGFEMRYVKSLTGATAKEALALDETAKHLGQTTLFYSQDVASGMRMLAMAGMNAQEVTANITAATALAGATMSQLGGKGGAADIMTNVMRNFNINYSHAMDVADILTYATNKANVDMFDLGEALKYAGSTSMDLGITLQESVAMIMAMSNAGIQGSMAGVAMENAMRYLAKSFSDFGSSASKQAIESIGMTLNDVVDNKGNFLTMTQIIEKMGNAIDKTFGKDMNREKQNVLQAIFGVRGKRASSLLLRNMKEFGEFSKGISLEAPGQSGRTMGDLMTELYAKFVNVKHAWQNMWISFVDSMAPTLTWVLTGAKQIVEALESIFKTPYLGPFLATGIAGFITWTTVASGYRAVQAGIRLLTIQTTGAMAAQTSTTVSGYAAQTAAARTYAATVEGIALSTRAMNTAASASYLRDLVLSGQLAGYRINARGGFVNTATGRLTKLQDVAHSAATAGLVGAAAGGAARAGAGAAGVGLGSRVLGFLGGPWGMALSFLIPAAIGLLSSALDKNRSSVDNNTQKLDDVTANKQNNLIYQSEFVPMQLGPKIMALNAMGYNRISTDLMTKGFADAVKEFVNNSNQTGGDINIYLDGQKIFSKPVDKIKGEFRKIGIYQ